MSRRRADELNHDEYSLVRAGDIMGRGSDLIVLGGSHVDSRPAQLLLPLLRQMKEQHGLTHLGIESPDRAAAQALNDGTIPSCNWPAWSQFLAIAARQAGLRIAAVDIAADEVAHSPDEWIDLRDISMAGEIKTTLQESRGAKMLMFVGWDHVRPERQGLVHHARRLGLRVRRIAVAGEIDPAELGLDMGFDRPAIESFMARRGLDAVPATLERSFRSDNAVPLGCDALLRLPKFGLTPDIEGSEAMQTFDVPLYDDQFMKHLYNKGLPSATLGDLVVGAFVGERKKAYALVAACLNEAIARGDEAAVLDLVAVRSAALIPACREYVSDPDKRSAISSNFKAQLRAATLVGTPGAEQYVQALGAIASGVITPIGNSLDQGIGPPG